jgi:regulator of replication initiation timing
VRGVPPTGDLFLLELATENAELRLQLAEAQEQLVEMAVDAGELNVEITALRLRLAHVEKQRDAWQAEAERHSGRAVA